MEMNTVDVVCARCGWLIPAGEALGSVRPRRARRCMRVHVQWLCWSCSRPLAIKGFWTYDRAAAAQKRLERRGLAS